MQDPRDGRTSGGVTDYEGVDMSEAIKAWRAVRVARAHTEMARLEALMAASRRRLDEIERQRNAPCPGCVADGHIDEMGRPIPADAEASR